MERSRQYTLNKAFSWISSLQANQKGAFTLTSGSADMNVIFLIQSDGGATNVTPRHQGGLLWARCEGWGIHHPIPPDHPWLLKGFTLLTALSLQFTMLSCFISNMTEGNKDEHNYVKLVRFANASERQATASYSSW